MVSILQLLKSGPHLRQLTFPFKGAASWNHIYKSTLSIVMVAGQVLEVTNGHQLPLDTFDDAMKIISDMVGYNIGVWHTLTDGKGRTRTSARSARARERPRARRFNPSLTEQLLTKTTPVLIMKAAPRLPFPPKISQYQPLRASYSDNQIGLADYTLAKFFCLLSGSHKNQIT